MVLGGGIAKRLKMNENLSDLTTDLLFGAQQIADYMERPLRSTFHLLENGRLPAVKEGQHWVSSKSALRAHFEKLRAKTMEAVG
jgi:hypothetical protein